MAITSTDYITTGGGKLYIAPFDENGNVGPESYFGVTDNVTLSTTADYIEKPNTESSTQGVAKKVLKKRSATIKFETSEISPRMLSRAYAGKIKIISQSAVTDQAVTLTGVKQGFVYETGYVNLTSVTVKSSDDSVTYVEGTDYSVDMGAGRIEIIDGGAIQDDTDVNVTLSADAYERELVAALKTAQLEARLVFISEPQTGFRYKYTFKKVSISASGDFDLKSDDFAVLSFEGNALSDESVTSNDLSQYYDIEKIPVNA